MSGSFDPETLLIGVMGRPHGLDGELALRPYGGTFDLEGVPALLIERDGRRVECPVRDSRLTAQGWLVRLQGVDSRQAAEALTNAPVRVWRRLLPPLDPGEFYVEDLVGCQVETEEGKALGMVQGIFWNGAHDIMTIVAPAGGGADAKGSPQEVLIPVVPAFVRAVDAPARRVVVAWEGHD